MRVPSAHMCALGCILTAVPAYLSSTPACVEGNSNLITSSLFKNKPYLNCF